MGECLLCGSNAIINRQESAIRTIYNCRYCGVFVISDLVQDEVKSHACEIIAYLMRHKLTGHSDTVLVSFEKANIDRDYLQLTVEQIVGAFPSDFTSQMDMTLKNLALMSDFPGDEVKVEGLSMWPFFYLRKTNLDALAFIIKAMQSASLIEVTHHSENLFFPCGVTVAPKGWDRLAELKRGKTRGNTVFVCAPRGKSEMIDSIYKAVKKHCSSFGLNYADNTSVKSDAKIGFEVVDAVRSAMLVICDLSDMPAEAYYAAALAKGFDKPCILTCNTAFKRTLQINTEQTRVIFWDKYEALEIELESDFKVFLRS